MERDETIRGGTMKRTLGIFAVVVACAVPVMAQDTNTEIELTRSVIQTERQNIVAKAMNLDPAEAEEFWPLYRQYQTDRAALVDRDVKLITDYADNFEIMTDVKAGQMLDEYLAIEKQYLKLKTNYAKKFRKILPEKKVTRFFQIENKLDAVIDAELAREIPLVE
jgi:hypothetical protein